MSTNSINLMNRVDQVKHVLDLYCESRMAECEVLPALDLCRAELASISDELEGMGAQAEAA
jgi:hypothetical protein